jgi:hypothetical protein
VPQVAASFSRLFTEPPPTATHPDLAGHDI